MSIHQPRYSIFKLLDTLTLLSAGNVVYHGQANNALEYFRGAGKQSIEAYTPCSILSPSSGIVTYCSYDIVFIDGAQIFIVKSMIIQLTSSWMSSFTAKGRELLKITLDLKVDPDIVIIPTTCL